MTRLTRYIVTKMHGNPYGSDTVLLNITTDDPIFVYRPRRVHSCSLHLSCIAEIPRMNPFPTTLFSLQKRSSLKL
ncbi:hypothetical protein BLNAU_20668 [Blattamonas nauphoetae]|uniref:Uncharacterized protein n=1 Tax=Blattamonas nauphoetae TaxID=2049346 RepID=A0ABQ9WYL4_9EUKA|nr:hypothetical protein BLNAU_20668 [Blattamonas nauphoetae]